MSESNLFCPWMVIANRCHRGGQARSGITPSTNGASGLLFVSFEVEEIDDKKSKATKWTDNAMVIPMGRKDDVHVVEHNGNLDVNLKSMQVRRSHRSQVPGRISVTEFTRQLTSELDMATTCDRPSSSHIHALSGASNPMVQSSDDEKYYFLYSPKVLP
ncbi:hypothetical protein V6N11_055704 [Hibiscus sabdariffa]|uniref:Uncharacterized protein n=1 Tax=Hibiscus sabdariffa TaxID=183260 RepID=A0ABR2NHM2_9ROSI